MSDKLFFNYSRSALYFGIKNLKFLQSTDIKNKILIPSYICNTIIQPIKENNLDITFYKINKDLTTDWDDLVSKIDNKLEELRNLRNQLYYLSKSCSGDHRPDCPILDALASEN